MPSSSPAEENEGEYAQELIRGDEMAANRRRGECGIKLCGT